MFDTMSVREDICVQDHVSQEKDMGDIKLFHHRCFLLQVYSLSLQKNFFLYCYLLSTYMGSEKSSLYIYI